MTLPAIEAFLREAFHTIDTVAGEPGERPVEVRLLFEAVSLTDATLLADDLRRVTGRRVRIRPALLRRRWVVTLVVEAPPVAMPLIRLCERRLDDLGRHRPGCRFVGRPRTHGVA